MSCSAVSMSCYSLDMDVQLAITCFLLKWRTSVNLNNKLKVASVYLSIYLSLSIYRVCVYVFELGTKPYPWYKVIKLSYLFPYLN